MAKGKVEAEKGKVLVSFLGDCSGGITAAVLAIPGNMVCGLIAFAPLGASYSTYGMISAMFVSVFTGLTAGAFGSIRSMITGPQVSTAIIFASLLDRLIKSGMFSLTRQGDATLLLAFAFGAVMLSGVAQVLLSVFRAGKLIKYIPYPVLAAIFDGTAILIIGGQIPAIADIAFSVNWLKQPLPEILGRLAQFDAFKVGITLLTFIVSLLVGIMFKKLPAPLIALLLGTAAFYAVEFFFFRDKLAEAVGQLKPSSIGFAFDIVKSSPALIGEKYRKLYSMIAYSALSIAVIGSLNTLFAGISLGGKLQKKHSGNRDLFGQGIGNAVGAIFGAIPGEGFLTRTLVNWSAGGKTFFSVAIYSGAVFLLVFFFNGYFPLIPRPVISGIMLHTGIRIIDSWSLGLFARLFSRKTNFKKEIVLNILVLATVVVVSLVFDLITAVFAGLVLSVVIFFGQMNEDIIRRKYTGAIVHSRKGRNLRCMDLLERNGGSIIALEMEGAFFFGSAVAVADRIDSLMEGKPKFLILDFRRVTRVDASGIKMLRTIADKLAAVKVRFLLSALPSNGSLRLFMNDFKLTKGSGEGKPRMFQDADYALEYAEDELLRELGVNPSAAGSLDLEECLVSYGFTAVQAGKLAKYFESKEMEKGSVIFKVDSTGSSLYLITSGLAEALIPISAKGRHARVASYLPGTMFGETALIDGRPRSMTVRLLENSVCCRLSRVKFGQMRKREPSLAVHLLEVIGKISAANLRNAYDALAEYEKG